MSVLLFTAVLNMSMTASYIVLGVLLIRLLLRKLPRIFAYVLWSAVWIRLVLPISFTSSFSFLTIFKPKVQANTGILEYIPYNIGLMQQPTVEVGVSSLNQAVNNLLPAATPTASANPIQIYMFVFSCIWVIGIIVLLIYSVFAYLKVISSIKTATLVRDNIYETDQIDTPFVFGLIKPKIYLPLNLPTNELPYILAHEQTHIKRLDYLVKPFSFLVLIIHWFNPLIWLSFALMSKDMEMSCDENVIRQMGNGSKIGYSNSLLSLSVARSGLIKGSPLAFGESHIKSRIKHILSYKKSALWVTLLAIVVTASVIAAFTANPNNKQAAPANPADSGVIKNDFDVTKLSLLASLPDKAIHLYSGESDGVILDVGGSRHYYDWLYMTPREILPRIRVSDLDADGNEELSVILYMGSGAGVSIEELHVMQIPGEQILAGKRSDNLNPEYFKDHLFKPDDYRAQLLNAVRFEVLTQDGELIGKVTIGEKVETLSLKDFQASEYSKINEDLVFGSIVRFNGESDKLKAEFGVGITTESSPVPNYIGVIDAEVDYKAGEFRLKNLRFEKNQENQ